jgi:hypothetical protein
MTAQLLPDEPRVTEPGALYRKRRCSGITAKGLQCGRFVFGKSDYCGQHRPQPQRMVPSSR